MEEVCIVHVHASYNGALRIHANYIVIKCPMLLDGFIYLYLNNGTTQQKPFSPQALASLY